MWTLSIFKCAFSLLLLVETKRVHGPHKHFNGQNYVNNVLYHELNTLMHRYEERMEKPHSRDSMT